MVRAGQCANSAVRHCAESQTDLLTFCGSRRYAFLLGECSLPGRSETARQLAIAFLWCDRGCCQGRRLMTEIACDAHRAEPDKRSRPMDSGGLLCRLLLPRYDRWVFGLSVLRTPASGPAVIAPACAESPHAEPQLYRPYAGTRSRRGRGCPLPVNRDCWCTRWQCIYCPA